MSASGTTQERREPFVRRWLNPADRMAEAIYGILILMTFTMAFQATTDDTAIVSLGAVEVRGMLLAAIGCALAWGLIDGVMYVLTSVFERGEQVRIARLVRGAPGPERAIELIGEALDARLAPLASPEERRRLYERIYERVRRMPAESISPQREDLYGGLATLGVAIFATLPAVIPFLFFPESPFLALRVSNGIAVLMLFLLGWRWAAAVGARPFWTGLALALLGTLLVLVAIPLGG